MLGLDLDSPHPTLYLHTYAKAGKSLKTPSILNRWRVKRAAHSAGRTQWIWRGILALLLINLLVFWLLFSANAAA